jgi:hypothetical protein
MTSGCDRIAYEAKKVTTKVANIYQKKLNRMPDPEGQWYVCNEKYPGGTTATMMCMIQNGWMRNPQWDACARGASSKCSDADINPSWVRIPF